MSSYLSEAQRRYAAYPGLNIRVSGGNCDICGKGKGQGGSGGHERCSKIRQQRNKKLNAK